MFKRRVYNVIQSYVCLKKSNMNIKSPKVSNRIGKREKMSSAYLDFPSTLEGFGYGFNINGQLRKIDPSSGDTTEEGFEFNVSSDPGYNQRHYEALGEVLTEMVYKMLEDEGLARVPVPADAADASFIFASSNAQTCEKLLVLIHGTGVVRAGQWARSLIINDNLNSGTQLPYIRKAVELGYGVVVFNTNDTYRIVDGVKTEILGSKTTAEHAQNAWKDYVSPSKAQHVAIVAHSFGGVVTMSLASQFEEDFLKRVFAIALTDSVHGKIPRVVSSELADHISKIACNWVSCGEPLDFELPEQAGEIPRVSAGTPKHEMTSWSCIESVFRFIEDRLQSGYTSRRTDT